MQFFLMKEKLKDKHKRFMTHNLNVEEKENVNCIMKYRYFSK